MSAALPALEPSFELCGKRTLPNEKAPTLTFAASSKLAAPMDGGDVLEASEIFVSGSITNNVAPAGTVRTWQPWDLITRLRVTAPGGDVVDCSGVAAAAVSALRAPRPDFVDDVSSTEAASGGATVNFSGRLRISYVERKARPKHSGLLCTALSSREGAFRVQLETAAGVAGLIDGSNATLNATTFELYKRRLDGLEGIDPSGYGLHPIKGRTETEAVRTLNARKPFSLERGRFLHGILLVCRDTANRVLSDSVLTATGNITVKIGSNPVFQGTVQALRAAQRDLFPAGIASLTGLLYIPFVNTDGTEDAVASQGIYLPQNIESVIELPTTATATNEVEIVELQRMDYSEAAVQLGLPMPE